MQKTKKEFDIDDVIKRLKHFLPSQSPLKDFIHHNTLHAFQDMPFHKALQNASHLFGYQTYLRLKDYRDFYTQGQISDYALDYVLSIHKGIHLKNTWLNLLLEGEFDENKKAQIGRLRAQWKELYQVNPDKSIQATLFRVLSSYLDQGVSIHAIPGHQPDFISTLRDLEKNSLISLFSSKRARQILLHAEHLKIESLLQVIVGDPALFEHYLFDLLFAHPGWSGLVSVLEDKPEALFDKRLIRLEELIQFELLLELDALDSKLGENWAALSYHLPGFKSDLFVPYEKQTLDELLFLWQEAYEWSYYFPVLKGIQLNSQRNVNSSTPPGFHALFCIDDRECSLRRHLETIDHGAKTYGTPGFFHVEFYFQPEGSNFYTKVCPAPMNPNYIIHEKGNGLKRKKDVRVSKKTHTLFNGWLISQTLGFWSALKLFFNIFKPGIGPASTYSFNHMDKNAQLQIDFENDAHRTDQLQSGFKEIEMVDRMEALFKSIGLIDIATPFVYLVGHGASSINNTYYAGYDCGACSGRPGSVNARTAAYMANKPAIRKGLLERGIKIEEHTVFMGALHDTTRDEIQFYDVDLLDTHQFQVHQSHVESFTHALRANAVERSRKFMHINTHANLNQVHKKIKLRSVSLFEPRPELNHANNALCIVGRRPLTKNLFLDRRAFLNSYDYRIDANGNYLSQIINAVAPVCGGINLEYYFSRVDNSRLGAGSKLPHNVMGLIGVANGTDGDLRTGLPLQMIELHDPIRLMLIVECPTARVLEVIQRSAQTYEWFKNDWIHLIVLDPVDRQTYQFSKEKFHPLQLPELSLLRSQNLSELIKNNEGNMPVMLLEEQVV